MWWYKGIKRTTLTMVLLLTMLLFQTTTTGSEILKAGTPWLTGILLSHQLTSLSLLTPKLSLLLEPHSHSQVLLWSSLQSWHWLETHLRNVCLPNPSLSWVHWTLIQPTLRFSLFFGGYILWFCSFLPAYRTLQYFLVDLEVWIRILGQNLSLFQDQIQKLDHTSEVFSRTIM